MWKVELQSGDLFRATSLRPQIAVSLLYKPSLHIANCESLPYARDILFFVCVRGRRADYIFKKGKGNFRIPPLTKRRVSVK